MEIGRRIPLRLRERSLHRRVIALFWALAFVLGTVDEGFGLHPCPHHDGGAHAAPAARSGHAGHHAAPAPDGHNDGATAATAADDLGHAPADSHDGPCTCGGACQAGPGVALPALAQPEPAASIGPATAPRLPAGADRHRQRPPHFLPFSQAPPRLG